MARIYFLRDSVEVPFEEAVTILRTLYGVPIGKTVQNAPSELKLRAQFVEARDGVELQFQSIEGEYYLGVNLGRGKKCVSFGQKGFSSDLQDSNLG